jgi:hypothetical protein
MSIAWLNPAALWGLALLAIPLAIHLLVRQQTRSVHFPSLRFLRETALAAFRRRAIQDAVLLACRAAIVIAAVLALAAPVLQTSARTAQYANRLSRAVVQLDDGSVDAGLTREVFRTRTFRRANVADAIHQAVRWLDAQPASAREIAFTGALRKGQIASSDLHLVPEGVGVRFAATPASPSGDTLTQTTLARRDGRLVFVEQQVRLTADATHVTRGSEAPAPDDVIRVIAAAQDQRLADAALRAALDAGVRWPDRDRRVVVVWEGGTTPDNTKAATLRMPVPDPPSSAATALWNVVDAATPRQGVEPIAIARADLDAWSRPARGISPQAQPGDEGDRRWFWLIALALLALEYWLRRERAVAVPAHQEQRVA